MTLKVKTYLDKSNLHGIGLFAGEFITKGQLVWQHDPLIDGWLPSLHNYAYDDITRENFNYMYCYDKDLDKIIHFADNVRFINHNSEPNLTAPTKYIHYAAIDITPGEELTINYELVCDNGKGFK
jgi:SET domain-containing protein